MFCRCPVSRVQTKTTLECELESNGGPRGESFSVNEDDEPEFCWGLDPVHTFFSVHDVHQPALDESRVLAAITSGHWNFQILVLVTDNRDRADKVLRY